MMSIIIGLFFIALGIWGVFDEWYYVVDFIKGFTVVFLLIFGHFAILAGVTRPKKREASTEGDSLPYSGRARGQK